MLLRRGDRVCLKDRIETGTVRKIYSNGLYVTIDWDPQFERHLSFLYPADQLEKAFKTIPSA